VNTAVFGEVLGTRGHPLSRVARNLYSVAFLLLEEGAHLLV